MAVLAAARVIRSGRADVALAGGADGLCAETYRGYALCGLLSPSRGRGAEGCRPFASDRNGPVLGEAGAFLVLEEREHCLLRGGKLLASLAGEAMSGKLADAMRRALSGAGIEPPRVSAVFSAASGDPEGDERESLALREVFGDKLPRILALKSQVGECMGAFGPLNLIGALTHLSEGGEVAVTERPPGRCAVVNCTDPEGSAVSLVVDADALTS
jgi:3-oxoacyl-[acyl-carrier-protein] synthase II